MLNFKKLESIGKEEIARRKRLLKEAMKNYIPIKKSIYINRKKVIFTDDEAYVCSCQPPKINGPITIENLGCNHDCVNKLISWECVEHLCPCGSMCSNRRFQNHEYAEVYPMKTDDKGWGLFAGEDLPKGKFIMQYIGEIYSVDSDYAEQKFEEYSKRNDTYLMTLSKDELIDPTYKGNLARLINHSCEPNCETQKWYVLGEICIGIFTKRPIKIGEELTFNYGFSFDKTKIQKCYCGTAKCTGYMGLSANKLKEKIGKKCESCKRIIRKIDSLQICQKCRAVCHAGCTTVGENNLFNCLNCQKKIDKKKKKVEEQEEKEIEVVDIEMSLKSQESSLNLDIEESLVDYVFELADYQLTYIKKELGMLLASGARLFWDFSQEKIATKIELKISGTSEQVDLVVSQLTDLLKDKQAPTKENTVKVLKVSKMFVRKLIGHQGRNLDKFRLNYSVEIDFDLAYMKDEIFPLEEMTEIRIIGLERNIRQVEAELKKNLFGLKVKTLFFLPFDYNSIKKNICFLKSEIDPADLRLRNKDDRPDREIKHSFFFVSNSQKDLVIIGFEHEIFRAETIINEFLRRQNNLLYNNSFSFLCPVIYKDFVYDYFQEHRHELKVIYRIIEPNSLRKHLNIYLEGKWKDIIFVKEDMWSRLNKKFEAKKFQIDEFEQYAYNQEMKLVSKNLRKSFIENRAFSLKNWDLMSSEVFVGLSEEISNKQNYGRLDNFFNNMERDISLNYSLITSPCSLNNQAKGTSSKHFTDLVSFVEEAYLSYKHVTESNNYSDLSKFNYKKESEKKFLATELLSTITDKIRTSSKFNDNEQEKFDFKYNKISQLNVNININAYQDKLKEEEEIYYSRKKRYAESRERMRRRSNSLSQRRNRSRSDRRRSLDEGSRYDDRRRNRDYHERRRSYEDQRSNDFRRRSYERRDHRERRFQSGERNERRYRHDSYERRSRDRRERRRSADSRY